jgi:hypothetical protein
LLHPYQHQLLLLLLCAQVVKVILFEFDALHPLDIDDQVPLVVTLQPTRQIIRITYHLGLLDLLGHMLVGYGIQEEIVDLRVHYCRTYVVPLQRLPVVFGGIIVRLVCHLDYEHLACLRKENRGFSGDHADVLIGLHDFLDPRQGQLLVLESLQIIYTSLIRVIRVLFGMRSISSLILLSLSLSYLRWSK